MAFIYSKQRFKGIVGSVLPFQISACCGSLETVTLGVLIFANFSILQNLIGQKQRITLQTFKGKVIREN